MKPSKAVLLEWAHIAVRAAEGNYREMNRIRPDWRQRIDALAENTPDNYEELVARMVDALQRPWWELNEPYYGGA